MNKRYVFCILLVSLAPAFAAAAEPDGTANSKFCWPLNFGGVVAGTTNDAQVVRLLGAGALRPFEEDGVRYYLDRNKRATLRIANFTDAVVGEISLPEGVAPGLSTDERRRAVSRYFEPFKGFGSWHALKLGATKGELRSNLSTPAKTEDDDTWVCEAACTCELPEYLTSYFRADKAVRIIFSAPPG